MKTTKLLMSIMATALCGLLSGTAARAGDISGQWRAEFDTPISPQKYLFAFQVNEGKVTGKATAELGGRKREVEFRETQLAGDALTFVEMFKFQDNEVRIDYTGKTGDNEIKFIRKVADFATEEVVAKRVATASEVNAASSTNANLNNLYLFVQRIFR
ncbi:exported hypothetical protein [Verrucomicrobia bacterium]|nr:exported hypothetical protein [Verrucomicrobiota bacterium]